jgi:hypothetical protein
MAQAGRERYGMVSRNRGIVVVGAGTPPTLPLSPLVAEIMVALSYGSSRRAILNPRLLEIRIALLGGAVPVNARKPIDRLAVGSLRPRWPNGCE